MDKQEARWLHVSYICLSRSKGGLWGDTTFLVTGPVTPDTLKALKSSIADKSDCPPADVVLRSLVRLESL